MSTVRWKFDNLDAVDRRVKDAAADAVFEGLEDILGAATDDVPWAEGTLSDSGDTDADRDGLRGTVFYGGEASAYAVRQHEDTTLSHPNGRKPKWLELAFRSRIAQVRQRMAERLKAAM